MSEFSINFMGQRKIAGIVSIVLVLAGLIGIITKGLDLGLDFTGGTLIEMEYGQPADLEQVRQVLVEQGIDNAIVVPFGSEREVMVRFQGSFTDVAIDRVRDALVAELGPNDLTVQVERMGSDYQNRVIVNQSGLGERQAQLLPTEAFGSVTVREREDATEFLLRENIDNAMSEAVVAALSEAAGVDVELRRSEFVGSQVGDELTESATWAGLTALAVIMLYVTLRFQFKFSVGAVVALAHDVLIVLGLFAIFQWDFDLTVFAAVLAVIGYSLNDTIVVSDRIRENFRKVRNREPHEIINISLNQIFGRTLVTSLTTLLVLFALFFIGGETIHNFSLALIIGVIIGTYSSIYVAANILLAMNINKEDLMVPVKEGEEFDEIP